MDSVKLAVNGTLMRGLPLEKNLLVCFLTVRIDEREDSGKAYFPLQLVKYRFSLSR